MLFHLMGCSPSTQMPDGDYTHGVYKFTFSEEWVSGWPFGGWDFVYTYDGEEIKNGHKILFSLELFTFYSIEVNVMERRNPENSYSVTFPAAICDSGGGETEIIVTGSNGKTTTYKITCDITQVGKR